MLKTKFLSFWFIQSKVLYTEQKSFFFYINQASFSDNITKNSEFVYKTFKSANKKSSTKRTSSDSKNRHHLANRTVN